MSAASSIEWTDATYSPIRARVKDNAPYIAMLHGWKELAEICERMKGHCGPHCEVISTGCNHCYSCTNNHRCLPSNGTGLPFDKRSRELVDIFVDEKILTQPLHWKKGKKVFVENQSDLFGEWVPFEFVDRVFAVMALSPQHTYQVLTKRPDRMLEYLGRNAEPGKNIAEHEEEIIERWGSAAGTLLDGDWIHGPGKRFRSGIESFISASLGLDADGNMLAEDEIRFPLPNVWIGVSVENQDALQRIDVLKDVPAAVRFVSFEPLLENLGAVILDGIHWAIIGGESGHKARSMHHNWARSLIRQCREQSVRPFMKQLGRNPVFQDPASSKPHQLSWPLDIDKAHGGNPLEWPEDLRVREYPEVSA